MAYLTYRLENILISSVLNPLLLDPADVLALAEAEIEVLSLNSVRLAATNPVSGQVVTIELLGANSGGFAPAPGNQIIGVLISLSQVALDPTDPSGDIVWTGLSVPTNALIDAIGNVDLPAIEALLLGGADSVAGSDSVDAMYGGAGRDTMHGGGGDDLAIGGTDHDRIYGGEGNDVLYGDHPFAPGSGNDRLYGENGNDTAHGGQGADILFGGSGNDVLVGGAGNDLLQGDRGADALFGGTGADKFRFLRVQDSGVNPLLRDTVQDFRPGEGDRIDLSLMDGNTVLAGVQGLISGNLGNGILFAANAPGQALWQATTGGVLLQISTDNDTAAEFAVLIRGVSSLSAADLVWSA
jgi:Ca2+-binding RTX toxin-like protein